MGTVRAEQFIGRAKNMPSIQKFSYRRQPAWPSLAGCNNLQADGQRAAVGAGMVPLVPQRLGGKVVFTGCCRRVLAAGALVATNFRRLAANTTGLATHISRARREGFLAVWCLPIVRLPAIQPLRGPSSLPKYSQKGPPPMFDKIPDRQPGRDCLPAL